MRVGSILLASMLLLPLAQGGVSPATRVHTSNSKVDKGLGLESLVDLVVDLDLSDVEITDVDEADEPSDESSATTLCLAPPCNHKAEAVALETLPVPWAMRIAPA
mmetsp:Transcript_34939/g.87854  ORF Transcript_34939/g.87854 Transcript_34939/m.87854 type:complete len:105 (+) Transcript_34939:1237-1551(+)